MKNLTKGIEITTDLVLASLLLVIVMGTFVFGLNLSPIGIEQFDNDFDVLGIDSQEQSSTVTFTPNILGTENMDVFIQDTNIDTTLVNYSFQGLDSGYLNYDAFSVKNDKAEQIVYSVEPQIDPELLKIISVKLVIGHEEYLLGGNGNSSQAVEIPVPANSTADVQLQLYSSSIVNFPIDFTILVEK